MNDVSVGWTILMMKELSEKRPECLFFCLRLQEPAAACQKGRLSFKPGLLRFGHWGLSLCCLNHPGSFLQQPKLICTAGDALDSVRGEGSCSGFLVELPLTEKGQSRGWKTPQKAAAAISESG